MEVVNPFILKNKEKMIVFLDQLSNVTDPFIPSNNSMETTCLTSNNTTSDTGWYYGNSFLLGCNTNLPFLAHFFKRKDARFLSVPVSVCLAVTLITLQKMNFWKKKFGRMIDIDLKIWISQKNFFFKFKFKMSVKDLL